MPNGYTSESRGHHSPGVLDQKMYQDWLASDAQAEGIISQIRGDPNYVKFLIIEYPRIRSALDVQALTWDEEEQLARLPSSIGNALHLDLIIFDEWWAALSPQDQRCIRRWSGSQERAPTVGFRFIGGYRDFSKHNVARRADALIVTLREQLDIPKPEEVS